MDQKHSGNNIGPPQGIPHRYQILKQLGAGGMGAVYLALDSNLDKKVALKVLSTMLLEENLALLQRFQREAKAAAKLSNKSLVTVLDFGLTPSGQPYLVMDYVSGPTLQERVQEQGSLSASETAEIISSLAAALSHAHAKGVVHRDLKSSNIVMTKRDDGEEYPVIIDFGISVLLDKHSDEPALTRTNAIVGSPLYMSPEQIKGSRADERSDIYSLGCVMYECLSGSPPFRGATAMDTMNMHLEMELPPLELESEELEAVLKRSLSKERSNRYQSMEEFHQALESPAYPESELIIEPTVLASEKVNKQRFTISLPILVLVVLVGTVVSFFLMNSLSPVTDKRLRTSKDTPDAIPSNAIEEHLNHPQSGLLSVKRLSAHELTYMLDVERNLKDSRVDLSGFKINPNHLAIIAKRKYIANINFNGAQFTDQRAFSRLQDLKLSTLTLRNSNVDDTGIETIAKLKYLTDLDIEVCDSLTEKSYETISTLSNLKNLQIAGDNVKDSAFAEIAKIKDLNSLTVKLARNVTDDGLKHLSGMPLQRLRLETNKKVGPGCLATISTLSSLRRLYLIDVPLGKHKKEFFECLNKLDKLEKLDLMRTGIKAADMKDYHKEHPNCELKFGLEDDIMDAYQ
ncbi:MAG: serine/threonine-protein kinase [Cyanobacteriota/Melainabacteria group bacterium]